MGIAFEVSARRAATSCRQPGRRIDCESSRCCSLPRGGPSAGAGAAAPRGIRLTVADVLLGCRTQEVWKKLLRISQAAQQLLFFWSPVRLRVQALLYASVLPCPLLPSSNTPLAKATNTHLLICVARGFSRC